jgi:hypothetical protein
MAQKNEKTSFNVSNNLKVALQAKGIYPPTETGQTFYEGAANDIHLLSEPQANGTFRTTNVTAGVVSFDFVRGDDPLLTRFWMEPELTDIIAGTPGVENSSGVFANTTWTWTIVFNGQNYNGTDASKPDAIIAKAFIKVVNLL